MRRLAAVWMCAASIGWGAAVTIQENGTLVTGTGALVNGQLIIAPTLAFAAADGQQVVLDPVVVNVVNGNLNITLEPNDTGVPANTSYTVRYKLSGGGEYTEFWLVTGSGTKRVQNVVVPVAPIPFLMVQWAQLTGIPSTFTPALHAATHKNGGADEVATATAGANAIPKAGAGGTLAIGWVPTGQTSSTVPLGNDARFSDARTPVAHASTHQNGGSDEVATATPGANAIPKAGSGGTLAASWLPAANGSTAGYLASADWTTFNGKYGSGSAIAPVSLTVNGGTTINKIVKGSQSITLFCSMQNTCIQAFTVTGIVQGDVFQATGRLTHERGSGPFVQEICNFNITAANTVTIVCFAGSSSVNFADTFDWIYFH